MSLAFVYICLESIDRQLNNWNYHQH